MIGRQEALGKLRTAWSLGQMFVVVGEGGIGKSRLLSEFAGQDRSVLIGGARPEDATVPYSTLARLLAAAWDRFEPRLAKGVALDLGSLVPRLIEPDQRSASLATNADRLRFLGSVQSFAAACRAAGGRGILIDDLQFADNASAAMFRAMFDQGRGEQAPWRAGFATRVEPMGSEAQAFLEGLEASWRVARLELAPLQVQHIGELLTSLELDIQGERWASALARHAGGNPAYLLESIKTVLIEGSFAQLPETLPSTGRRAANGPGPATTGAWRPTRPRSLRGRSMPGTSCCGPRNASRSDLSEPNRLGSWCAAWKDGHPDRDRDSAPAFALRLRDAAAAGNRFLHDAAQQTVTPGPRWPARRRPRVPRHIRRRARSRCVRRWRAPGQARRDGR